MPEVLPVCAILPCKNNRLELPLHCQQIASWIPRVAQVVVVDSSTDGSLEFLKKTLTAPHIEFHSVPPGLYQAWNFGVDRSLQEFSYFSTVGDTIDIDGLEHLYHSASTHHLDLVVSPPAMVDAAGQTVTEFWPIHEFVSIMNTEFCVPNQAEAIRWLTAFLPFTLLGSSASNLYRTKLLKHTPFPTDFGHGGDAAFGVMIAGSAKMGITRRVCSRFVAHGPGREISAAEQVQVAKRFSLLLQQFSINSTEDKIPAVSLSSAILKNKISLLEWVSKLEPFAETIKEQNKYIEILQSEKATLIQEREILSRLTTGCPLPFLKSGHLLSFKRFIKRTLGF
jgi:hypothetical protein